eukprot:gnl/TRDRNA2_/TRDRNA2_61192_c0_seq1.p1 gnl/TRDRNA2_/TRDRNA2_61192_c0~~gnl/TRDRNA2_/TRDRNA2_61192_c0_seq1.p1  ORF type:complete len:275 (+),score=54.32 gnl/TRDRNA2_/TRDRNA2_61192_c0_seq1:3-827(+)
MPPAARSVHIPGMSRAAPTVQGADRQATLELPAARSLLIPRAQRPRYSEGYGEDYEDDDPGYGLRIPYDDLNPFDTDELPPSLRGLAPETLKESFKIYQNGEEQFSLLREVIQPCTLEWLESSQQYAPNKFCKWDAQLEGMHTVCVKVTKESPLHAMANQKAPGGQLCIDAFAWASAVVNDPAKTQGLQLNCDGTNLKLRDIYWWYENNSADKNKAATCGAALRKVEEVCVPPSPVYELDAGSDRGFVVGILAVAALAGCSWMCGVIKRKPLLG